MYCRSRARDDLELVLKDLQQQSVQVSKLEVPVAISQSVYRAAIFQTSAALEDYLRNVFEDWLFSIKTHNKLVTDLPDSLRSYVSILKVEPMFRNYFIGNEEWKLITNGKVQLIGSETKIEHLNASTLIHDRKYPSQKNIQGLFRRFGIDDIFVEANKKGQKDFKLVLKSFSDMRTEIAHKISTNLSLTFTDVEEKLDSITEFVSVLDRILYSHVARSCGHECWTRAT